MCEAIEEFTGVKSVTSLQHVDQRDARKIRDHQDLQILREWLSNHNPFTSRRKNELVSLATGLLGDDSINCDRALDIGQESMKKVNGSFGDMKLKRKDKVKPLSSMSHCITVRDTRVEVSPQQLFNRILCVMNSEDCLRKAFKYELAPKPPCLFDDISLRKTNKAELAKKLESYFPCSSTSLSDTDYVLDGGYLLHAVNWPPRPATYEDVCNSYVSHIERNYGKSCVTIFDGYRGETSTKIEEQKRRSAGKSCADLNVEIHLPTVTGKDEFLCNSENKAQLIDLLTQKLRVNQMVVHQAEADADTLIAETAISLSSNKPSVTVIATDTDILTILIARSDDENAPKLKMLKPGRQQTVSKYYDIAEIRQNMGPLKDVLLFAHAMSGCDTTSAFFRKGKVKTFECLSDTELRETVSVFNDSRAEHDDIAKAGEAFVLQIYKKSGLKLDLDELRFYLYKQTVAKQSIKDNFKLSTLPPTKDATRQHSFRVYLQVQRWLGNHLSPCEWGWTKRGQTLVPVTTELPPAPDGLLNLISCGCKKGCERWCECRKAGLLCSAMCRQCLGQSCANVSDAVHDDD